MDSTGKQYRRDQVVNIINSVIRKVEDAKVIVSRDSLYSELQSLHQLIEELRNELSTNPDEIRAHHIPSATDELDAIVQATAEATGSIMDVCEAIDEIAANTDEETRDRITEQITKIYEACSFQDITGQRITKVVNALKQIDEKVERILEAFGSADGVAEQWQPPEEELMSGPQLPDKAVSQDDIDKLLAEFD